MPRTKLHRELQLLHWRSISFSSNHKKNIRKRKTAKCSRLKTHVVVVSEITKNGYTRSSNNHFRVQRKSSTRTPPGRPLINRTTIVPGSGSKQSGCTRCAELMFRSTRYWLPLYPELVRSVQATRRRAHTPTRARVHTRISECTHDHPPGYGSPPHVKYSDILEHTTNPQDTDLRVHTRPTIRIRISAAVKYSDILLKYNNNAAKTLYFDEDTPKKLYFDV